MDNFQFSIRPKDALCVVLFDRYGSEKTVSVRDDGFLCPLHVHWRPGPLAVCENTLWRLRSYKSKCMLKFKTIGAAHGIDLMFIILAGEGGVIDRSCCFLVGCRCKKPSSRGSGTSRSGQRRPRALTMKTPWTQPQSLGR